VLLLVQGAEHKLMPRHNHLQTQPHRVSDIVALKQFRLHQVGNARGGAEGRRGAQLDATPRGVLLHRELPEPRGALSGPVRAAARADRPLRRFALSSPG
jgi:hypothetical protein